MAPGYHCKTFSCSSPRPIIKITNPIHLQILETFNNYHSKSDLKEKDWVQHYLGSNKPTHCMKTGEVVALAKDIVKQNDFNSKKLTDLLNSLYQNATTFCEIDMAARLLGQLPNLRKNLDPALLDNWLNYTHGWAEIDLLCQSNFTADELLSDWTTWKKLLIKFSDDKNIHKRRASIVLLTKSLRQSADSRLSDLAFVLVDKLKFESEILITKAVSWVLRSLIKYHPDDVANYLGNNESVLPRIAVREVKNKLATGRKNKQ